MEKPSPKKKQSRHGVRADGKTQTSISMRADLLEKAKKAAEADNRSLSNWLEILLRDKLGDNSDENE